MAIITKQLNLPFQSAYEANLVDPPAAVFLPIRAISNGGPSFRIGRIRLEIPGVLGAVIDRAIDFGLKLSKFRSWQGITNGGIQSVGMGLPVFFHKPDEMEAIDAPVLANPVVRINYEDYALKHQDLRVPTELTLVLEYIEKHPDVEALPDASLRKRIYDDLALSGYHMLEVDLDKYTSDPAYSAGLETARRLDAESMVGNRKYMEPAVFAALFPKLAAK